VLDLRQLEALRAVAAEGSVIGAARRLEVSQPTITHHLASLERHLGAPLVERTARGTTLTDLGTLLLGRATDVLERLASAEAEVRSLARHGVVTLRIGTFPTAGATLLPRAVAHVQRDTGVRVSLLEAEPRELLDRLATGQLHCALVFGDPHVDLVMPPELVARPLFDDPFRVVLPSDHRHAARDPLPLSLLADDGWVLAVSPDDPGDLALAAAAAAVGFQPRSVLRTDDYDVAFGFVAAGVGLALVPEMALVDRPDVVVRPVAGLDVRRRVQFVAFCDQRPPVVDALDSALREEVSRRADRRPRAEIMGADHGRANDSGVKA
jgi:DNA-binding transcriptional LysR family regulator